MTEIRTELRENVLPIVGRDRTTPSGSGVTANDVVTVTHKLAVTASVTVSVTAATDALTLLLD